MIKLPRPRRSAFLFPALLARLAVASALAGLIGAPASASGPASAGSSGARASASRASSIGPSDADPVMPPGSPAGAPSAPSSGPASPPASASPYGLIWLDVEPGPAEISLDGEFLDAGVWLISVSPGDHDLRIRKAGFRGYAGRVAVPAGGSVHLDVVLQPGAAGDS